MSVTTERTEWPRAAQIAVTIAAAASAALFLTGLALTVPVSTFTLIIGIVANRELGRFRAAVIILSALGLALALGWLMVSLDTGALHGLTGGEELRQGTPE